MKNYTLLTTNNFRLFLVLASSASNLPGATFGPQLMDNTSHMQARNNKALRDGLFLLYEGGTDPFFKTDKK